MQLDMFGATDESATGPASPPVIGTGGTWSTPEVVVFNAALKRGSLRDAIGILNNLKLNGAVQVLLASGFSIGGDKTRAGIMAGVQKELLEAIRSGMTAWELRSRRELESKNGPTTSATRITPAEAAGMVPDTRIVDSHGREYDVLRAHGTYLEVHPVVDGKTEVHAENAIYFHLDPNTAAQHPGRRHDSVYIGRVQVAAPLVTNEQIISQVEATSLGDEDGNGSIGVSSRIRTSTGIANRVDGEDRAHGGEPLDDGLAGTEQSASERGDLSATLGNSDEFGKGRFVGSGAPPAPFLDGNSQNERDPRSAAGTTARDQVDLTSTSPSKSFSSLKRASESVAIADGNRNNVVTSAAATRNELNAMLVTEMTDAQLLLAKELFADGRRATSIERQIEKRGLATLIEANLSNDTHQAENLAKRYAETLAAGREGVSTSVVEFHRKYAAAIIAKDAYALRWISNGLNDIAKSVFSEFTGHALPKLQGATWDALKQWGGITEEQEIAAATAAAAVRNADRLRTTDLAAEAAAEQQKYRLSVSDSAVVTGKEVVDRQIAEGHIEIRNISNTHIPKHVLFNPGTMRIYPLDKIAKAYAEVALRRLSLNGLSEIITSSPEKDAIDVGYSATSVANKETSTPIDTPANDAGGPSEAPSSAPSIGAQEAPTLPAAAQVDYTLSDEDRIGLGSLGEKYQDNLSAIAVLRAIAKENRSANVDELRALARYVGWGGLKGVFDPHNKQWAKQHTALRVLLTDAEWAAASRSQLNAFYTAPVVAKAMFSAVERLGFRRGRVIEPSMGVGHFFGWMPASMRDASDLHGVELDVLTSQIAAALYPNAKIAKATGFQTYDVPAGFFDMAIGNPPFGSETISDDKGTAYSGWSIHNYFFAKTIDMLRPGGIMPMVVSHNFLDKLDPHVRQWISRRAELISGVRLPNTTFKENANTEVVTDILIFRKLDHENELGRQSEPDWLKTTDIQIENPKTGAWEAISINNYFLNKPENILGTNSTTGSMYRSNEYTVLPNGNLQEQLENWVASLPEQIYTEVDRVEVVIGSNTEKIIIPGFVKEGSFFVSQKQVYERLADAFGEQRTRPWIASNQRALERMVGMIEIRDLLRKQMLVERSANATDSEIASGRKELNTSYDSFQKKNGFLNDPINRRLFLDDTESSLVQALEFDYEKAITQGKAADLGIEPRPARSVKADIFSRRVLFPPVEVVVVESAKDALLHSLNRTGGIDLNYMANAYGKSSAEIVNELGDLVYMDPDRGFVTADEYLSGDVKTKLSRATAAAAMDSLMFKNVEALKRIVPADKLPSEIHCAIGAAWIPPEFFADFAKTISGAETKFTYVTATAQWLGGPRTSVDFTKNNTEYGTEKLGALDIFLQTMNSKGLEVKKRTMVDGNERYVTDEEATEAVRQCSDKIRNLWDSWLWADGDRAERLSSLYNDRFNRTVERSYDGSHLTFPGMNPGISLLGHQKNGVWRALEDRGMLADQAVGAGKTFEMIAIAMEMRRLGIAKKTMIAVPNHLTLQWRSEFYRLYPGANVLAATPQDFDKENRERFFSKIVTGNWDAVIVGHSSLKKIEVPSEIELAIIGEQFDAIISSIKELKRDRGDRNIMRDLEKIKSNLESKMVRLKEKGGKKDKVVDFGDLGVDSLMVDELHEFKNLTFTTQMNRVSGLGNPAGSGKAFDLFVKVQFLKQIYGEKSPLITATGTPVSNSLAEMFTMQRYMQYSALKANGLHVFDAWAKQYGDVQNVYEVAPSGTGYRLSQRFAKFKNLASLMGQYRSFADVVTLDDLKRQELALGKSFPVPKLKGGGPENIVAKRSLLQEKFFGVPEIVRDKTGQISFGIDVGIPTKIVQRPDGKYVMEQTVDGIARQSQAHDTPEDAEYATALSAITPRMSIDPNSIVGQFENLRELTRRTKGKINALSLTGLANKAGLDYRLIDPTARDFEDSKINIAVRRLVSIGKKWDHLKGTQLIFCDLSVPLSAKSKMATKEKRIYVRSESGEIVHVKGTLHSVTDYEGLPYYLVAEGSSSSKTFAIFDPISGAMMKNGLDTKTEAHSFVSKFIRQENGQERWLDQRERHLAIGSDEIDEYKNEHSIDTEGDAADLEISAQDIEGASGVTGFSIYDDMKAKLILAGVPSHQIEFIHDHDTPQAKDLLFKRVNAGDVRYLFGSTPKMGAGTNVQQRLVALHHIDAPWRPSDLEQREGRIIRRGNLLYELDPTGFMIEVLRYATAQTYDTRRWQLLEHKAAGLEQLRNYNGANEIDDVANEASNSADMKAAASGNPLILKETQLATEVKKLRLLERAHRDGDFSVRSRLSRYRRYGEVEGPNELTRLQGFLINNETASEVGRFLGKVLVDKESVIAAVERIASVPPSAEMVKTLTYRGLDFEFEKKSGSMDFIMSMPDDEFTLIKSMSPSGVVTRMDNWANGIPSAIARTTAKIATSAQEVSKLTPLVGKSFPAAEDLGQAIANHGKVQRALMKSNSIAAVRPEQMGEFQAAVAVQKNLLRDLGFSRALDEIENEVDERHALAPGDGQSESKIAPSDPTSACDSRKQYDDVDIAMAHLATDKIAELIGSSRPANRQALANLIKIERPDLTEDVDAALSDIRADFRRRVHSVATSSQSALESVTSDFSDKAEGTDPCAKAIVADSGQFVGKVLAIENGVVTQQINRDGTIAYHDLSPGLQQVRIGEVINVNYKNGFGEITPITHAHTVAR